MIDYVIDKERLGSNLVTTLLCRLSRRPDWLDLLCSESPVGSIRGKPDLPLKVHVVTTLSTLACDVV